MKKYKFSVITRSYGKWSWERRDGLTNKYFSQIFDQDGNYVSIIVKDTYQEVVEEQKKWNEEVK
jgi:hypothetical protein